MEIGGRDQEGLETHDLKFKNISLLGKWDFKVLSQDEIWQTLLWKNHVGSRALSHVFSKLGVSDFWNGLMATKKFLIRTWFILN
jgi:hypothetical protein